MTTMRILVLGFLFTFISIGSIAQGSDITKFEERMIARDHIETLENGILLVRLFTNSKSVKALEEYNRFNDARRVTEKLHEENLRIAQAFNEFYNFTPVYFFYSEDSPAVIDQQWDSLEFMDANLKPLSTPIRPDNFLTAEFSKVRKDTAKVYTGTRVSQGENGPERKATYVSQPDFGFSAIIVMDQEFNQLRSPFPYYARIFKGIPILNRSHEEAVARLNEELIEFSKRP